jgi:hypothetical protein
MQGWAEIACAQSASAGAAGLHPAINRRDSLGKIIGMSGTIILALIVLGLLAAAALTFKPLRKTMGLLLVILGAIACLTFFGLIIGVPMIIVGGILLFI